jgi:NAD-dependent deacetylase
MTQYRSDVKRLSSCLASANRIVCFTGAGISTESGIPDFRSPNGLWSQFKPIEFQDFISDEAHRREAWRRKFIIDRDMRRAQPNRGHRAVAHLVADGRCACVITQNIDGLHQQSGIPANKIVELHGNGTYASCLECSARVELAPIQAAFELDGSLPYCEGCGGIVKTATISFGQAMPVSAMQRADAESSACDLFIVLGSSLVVYPAAAFPQRAKQRGAVLIIINRESTAQDASADLVIHGEIGATLGEALALE